MRRSGGSGTGPRSSWPTASHSKRGAWAPPSPRATSAKARAPSSKSASRSSPAADGRPLESDDARFAEQLSHRALDVGIEADPAGLHAACRVDGHNRRIAIDGERVRDGQVGVQGDIAHLKRGGERPYEARRFADVDRDDVDPRVGPGEALDQRNRLPARVAPRCVEVKEHEPAAPARQIEAAA